MRKHGRLKPAHMGDLGAGVRTASYGIGQPTAGTPVDVIGWSNRSGLSTQSDWQPVWVAKSRGGMSTAPKAAPAPVINVPVNISNPITTQTTTAVSPVLNVAAGSQGVSQGAQTAQTATPSSSNQTPQGSSVGLSPEQVRQMLEQQQRESDAMAQQRANIAAQAAALAAEQRAWQAAQQQQAEYDARIKALQAATQQQNAPQVQYAPQPLPAPAPAPTPAPAAAGDSKYPGLPPGTIIPGSKEQAGTDATALQDSKTVLKQPGIPLLAALAVGALIFMGGKKQPANKRKPRR